MNVSVHALLFRCSPNKEGMAIPDKICKGNAQEVHSMARPAMHAPQLNLILAQAQALYFTHANIQLFMYQPCERVRVRCVFVYA